MYRGGSRNAHASRCRVTYRTMGTPTIRYTFFEGTNKNIYNPSETVVLDKNGNVVSVMWRKQNK